MLVRRMWAQVYAGGWVLLTNVLHTKALPGAVTETKKDHVSRGAPARLLGKRISSVKQVEEAS
jgi:hypothetical protein